MCRRHPDRSREPTFPPPSKALADDEDTGPPSPGRCRAEFRRTLHPETPHCPSRRLWPVEVPGGPDGGPHGGDRGAAAVDGDRHRLRRIAGPRPLHGHRRRLPRLGARRQPLPDRRAGRRLHRAGGGDGRPARRRRAAARHAHGRRGAGRHRLSADRHLYQADPVSRHRRLHGRHRGHHLREPAQGTPRHHAAGQGAGRAHPETRGAGGSFGIDQPVRGGACRAC